MREICSLRQTCGGQFSTPGSPPPHPPRPGSHESFRINLAQRVFDASDPLPRRLKKGASATPSKTGSPSEKPQ